MHISRTQYEEMREIWRADLLYQMDRTMERFDRKAHRLAPSKTPGARDSDLPALFETFDAQLKRNLAHGGITAVVGGPGDYEVLA